MITSLDDLARYSAPDRENRAPVAAHSPSDFSKIISSTNASVRTVKLDLEATG